MFKSSIAVVLIFSVAKAIASDVGGGLFELNKEKINKEVIQVSTSSSSISFRVNASSHTGTISVSGPNGFNIVEAFDGSSKTLNLLEKYRRLPTGIYHYQITTHIGDLRLVKDTMNNGRGDNDFTYVGTPVNHSGSFRVNAGSIVRYNQQREASANEW